MIEQDIFLFSRSVSENIAFGKPSATQEEIKLVSDTAQADEFVQEFENKYDTVLGERGVTLSGGQRQRIAIARALLLKPKILILDDSTSSVDVETETKIQDALEELMQQHTSFVVAQRISTVLKADKIIVLEKGQVAAQGTHTELMKTSPIYQEIYDSQLGNGFREGNP
jgi:ATP-binding cassette subfamily B protein